MNEYEREVREGLKSHDWSVPDAAVASPAHLARRVHRRRRATIGATTAVALTLVVAGGFAVRQAGGTSPSRAAAGATPAAGTSATPSAVLPSSPQTTVGTSIAPTPSAPTPSATLAVGVLPWSPLSAAPISTSAKPAPPVATRACGTSDFTTATFVDSTDGRALIDVALTRTGSEVCSLPGAATVDSAGNRSGAGVPLNAGVGGPNLAVSPGGVVTYKLSTAASCPAAAAPNRKDIFIDHFSLHVGTGLTFVVAKAQLNILCGDVRLSAPQIADAAVATGASGIAAVPELGVTLTLPASVPAGSTLAYQVTLTNASSKSVSLTNCPAYDERIPDLNVHERYELNCAALPSVLAPQASEVLQMEMRVPSSAGPGAVKVSWVLSGSLSGGDVGQVAVG